MNVEDITDVPDHGGDKIGKIFARQRELMVKYHVIERANGFPVETHDLDDRHHQNRLKNMAWRIVEEIAEALDASSNEIHKLEEVADAAHFMVELLLASKMSELDLIPPSFRKDVPEHEVLDWYFMDALVLYNTTAPHGIPEFIRELGCAMNCLKNKPWKNTHMRTDVDEYKRRLRNAFAWFIYLCVEVGLTANELYRMYYKKSEVNKFRQASNY